MKNYEIGSDFYITPEVLDKINSVEDISNNDEISKHILKEDESTKLIFLGRFAIDLALKKKRRRASRIVERQGTPRLAGRC